MKKLKINQLKINTDTPDQMTTNKNQGGAQGTADTTNNQSVKLGRFSNAVNTNSNQSGLFSPIQKNFSTVQTSKLKKVTEFSKRNNNYNNETSENRKSFIESKNEYTSNGEKNIPISNNYGSFVDTLSPKISNSILSKTRLISPLVNKVEKTIVRTGKNNENSALVNSLVSPTNQANKTKKLASNLISMVKENRNGGNIVQSESSAKVKNIEKELKEINSNPSNFNSNINEKSIANPSIPKNEFIYNSPTPSHFNKNNSLQSEYLSNSIQEPVKITNTNENNPNTFTQEAISVTSLMNNQNIPIELSNLSVFFPNYDTTKCSSRPIGNISAYGVNTYQGIIRNYNEDRVSIILNIAKPQNFHGTWPKCSFFGIYDGHGGCLCSDFLRDQLHSYVIRDSNFPKDPIAALIRGFEEAERDFVNNFALNKNKEVVDKSGSCAIVALIVEDDCYVANVGDSRAVLSLKGGKKMEVLSNDHKPNEEGENKRIIENGGKVYQTQTPAKLLNIPNMITNGNNSNQVLVGPYRVFPGRLSVSRTFGDVEAKIPKYGGIPGVIIATPDIRSFKITDDSDFLVLGCDGIFDQISNIEILDCVWMTMSETTRTNNINTQCALGADMIMKSSLVRRTLDNVTIALIAFQNFEKVFNETLVKSAKRTETYSPKSSFYLYNVIENKENPILQDSTSNHTSEPAIIVYPNKNKNASVSSKNVKTAGSRKNLNEPPPENKFKLKYLSPAQASTNSKAKLNNWPGATNINYTSNNTNNSTKNTLNKLNKVLSFEVKKKIVLSPKNKNEDIYKTENNRKDFYSPVIRAKQYDSEKPVSLKDRK